jgi:hypothetical protein
MEKDKKKSRAQVVTTIDLPEEIRDELKKKKISLGVKTYGAVIQILLERYSIGAGAVAAACNAPSSADEENDDDEKVPVQQILYASEVIKNEEVVQYYTGLRRGAYLWLQKAMVAAVRFSTFFENGSSKMRRRFRRLCVPLFDFLIPVLLL